VASTMLTLLNAQDMHRFYAEGHWRDDTIYSLVADNARKTPNKVALRDRQRAISYGELVACVDALAGDLHRNGVKAGERVAVWLPSRLETAVALLACSRNGYVCCPSLHRDHTVAEIRDLMVRMRASALITEHGYGADAHKADIFKELDAVKSLRVVYGLQPLKADEAKLSYADLSGEPPAMRTDPNTIVYLAFTSGTTGIPKGVMHSDNTLLANARALSGDWSLLEDSVVYSMSPLSHNLGFGACGMTLIRGGEFIVHDLPRGGSLVDRIIDTGTTFIIGVPTHAIDLLSEIRMRGLKQLGKVKGFRISGASVPPSVAAGLLDHGVVPQSGYGMTEAGSHHYTVPSDDAQTICETSGRACSGYEVKIFSQEDPDKELPAGETGQIGGRGASLMLGYFDDQEATESSFNRSGWFMTGDLGWMDEKGYLRITGRKKDVIIRGGHNIYPARIEALAMRHSLIDKAAALPVADDRLGEKVCLAVVLRQQDGMSPEALLHHLDDAGLSRFDMPEFVLMLDKMPLTPSGKILKRDLVTGVAEGKLAPIPVRFKPKAVA